MNIFFFWNKNPTNGDTLGPRVRLVYHGKIYAYIFLFIYDPWGLRPHGGYAPYMTWLQRHLNTVDKYQTKNLLTDIT